MENYENLKILLIDDEVHIRTLFRVTLSQMSLTHILEAGNGRDGVELFRQENPDMVILDINMPVMDGKEALTEIIKHNPDANVIMLTSITDKGTIQECAELGASNFLRKDTPIDEMTEIFKKHLNEIAK